jgi:hypothetical protein
VPDPVEEPDDDAGEAGPADESVVVDAPSLFEPDDLAPSPDGFRA